MVRSAERPRQQKKASDTNVAFLNNICTDLWHAALPQDCLLCGAWSGNAPLCGPCRDELPTLPAGCRVCAMPSPGEQVCGACLRDGPQFDATVAAWRYAYPVDRLVQALKFHGRLPLASLFAQALAARVVLPDIIIPMPLHPARLAERGFNQAAEIARHLAEPAMIALDGARRMRHTLPQAGLPIDDRPGNVRHAFACNLDLRGACVAVVDDVMTTGATLNELAKVLKRAGAARVENWVVARTLD
jgi:ComF family protein